MKDTEILYVITITVSLASRNIFVLEGAVVFFSRFRLTDRVQEVSPKAIIASLYLYLAYIAIGK